MAKLTGRNFKEVARVGFLTRPLSAGTDGLTGILVLRSDGKVLRRFTGDTPTGYSILGSIDTTRPLTVERLEKVVANRRWLLTSANTRV